MFIKKIKLTNIRSYLDTEIDFQEGITLLSGDIGSGKTTILMALEFALFGILRGKTSPGELLRHGAKEGSVTLDCEIDNKNIKITRALRRRGDNISQLPGRIQIDDVEDDLVATELKAKILNLLGYPETLLSKSTNLFRYTVYTPQEQVKQILMETEEERKDIIRKIFNIDKYKTISENASIYQNDIRVRVNFLEKSFDDLKTLNEQLVSQEKELTTIKNQIPIHEEEYLSAKEKTKKLEDDLLSLRKKQEERRKLENTITAIKNKLELEESLKNQFEKQILQLKKDINLLEQDLLSEFSIHADTRTDNDLSEEMISDILSEEKITNLISEEQSNLTDKKTKLAEQKEKLKLNLEKLKKNLIIIHKKEGIVEDKLKNVSDDKIQSLTICPTCKQVVDESHKHKIKQLQETEKEKLLLQQKQLNEMSTNFKEKQDLFETKLSTILDEEKNIFLSEQKINQKKEKHIRLNNLKEQLSKLTADHQKYSNLIITGQKNLAEELEKLKLIPEIKTDAQEDLLRKQRSIEREKEKLFVELKTKEKYSEDKKLLLLNEIKKKEQTKKEVGHLKNIKHWLNELFIPLINSIEKKVLFKVYKEFHNYFTNWFSMLIGTEDMIVRLDENFTPRITQQGFDTNIDNLSGGEKTAVALSYRLALNKVLNDYFGTLNTKGLLILDEPTDGFSSEQIDLLREVLEQLNLKQLIIVSHEQRLESLANNVIRIRKTNHQSLAE